MDCAIPTAENEPAVLFPFFIALGLVSLGFMAILIHRYGFGTLFNPTQTLQFDHPYMKYAAIPCVAVTFYVYLGSHYADELGTHICGIVAEPTLYPTAFLLTWLSFGGIAALIAARKMFAERAKLQTILNLTVVTVSGTAISFVLATLGAPLIFQVWVPVVWGLASSYLSKVKQLPSPPAPNDA